MASAQLSASSRDTVGKGAARTLRSSGKIPGIIYGSARDAQSLVLDARELDKLLEHIAAGSTVIELALGGKTTRTLIREIQRHPFKKQILHVDFQELVAGEKITLSVPLAFVGIPEGVRASGGVLDQIMHDIEIEVDPANIPSHIDVDVTALTIGHSLHVSDLVLPAGVTVLDEADNTVCVVSAPRAVVEEVAVVPDTEAPAEPELIRKTKADEEEAE